MLSNTELVAVVREPETEARLTLVGPSAELREPQIAATLSLRELLAEVRELEG
jgi:hypothetical protein